MTRVFLGLGANVGNREENLRMALRLLAARCPVVAVSSLYSSPAMVPEGAEAGPDFLNAACAIETDLSPGELHAYAKEIERAIGRVPAPRWSARPIDIDVLLWESDVMETPDLVVPHPAMHERGFVLVPLAEIAGDAVHPTTRRTIGELTADVDRAGIERVAGPAWASLEERAN
jgi:2-amino-4-hydroxy-6-hydroxymethyldihydropteridine diphosphokinase